MLDATTLLSLALVWAMAVMLPGPNFLVVTKQTLRLSLRHGLTTAMGVSYGAFLWASAAMLGLSALLQTFSQLYALLKIIGGLYLLFLGIGMIRQSLRSTCNVQQATDISFTGSSFRAGLCSSLSNPKTAAFFAGIFVTFLPQHPGLAMQMAALALIFGISVLWYGALACFFSLARIRQAYAAMHRPLTFIMGGFFVLAGLKTASDFE